MKDFELEIIRFEAEDVIATSGEEDPVVNPDEPLDPTLPPDEDF